MIQAGSLIARYVGRTDQPYDFESGGERIKGVKRRAYFTDDDLQVTEVEVREDSAGLLDSLEFGEVYHLTAQPRAKGNRVVWVLLNVEPA